MKLIIFYLIGLAILGGVFYLSDFNFVSSLPGLAAYTGVFWFVEHQEKLKKRIDSDS